MTSWIARCLLPLLAVAASTGATAANAAHAAHGDRLSGHYHYSGYQVTLPNGRIVGLKELGATDASLEISVPARTITLRMTMGTGRVIEQSARIVEWAVGADGGYWIAQWPEMKYPVKALITVTGSRLASETRFDHAEDMDRFGTVERAVLDRQ